MAKRKSIAACFGQVCPKNPKTLATKSGQIGLNSGHCMLCQIFVDLDLKSLGNPVSQQPCNHWSMLQFCKSTMAENLWVFSIVQFCSNNEKSEAAQANYGGIMPVKMPIIYSCHNQSLLRPTNHGGAPQTAAGTFSNPPIM